MRMKFGSDFQHLWGCTLPEVVQCNVATTWLGLMYDNEKFTVSSITDRFHSAYWSKFVRKCANLSWAVVRYRSGILIYCSLFDYQ